MKLRMNKQNQELKMKVLWNALTNQQKSGDSRQQEELSEIAHIACINSFVSYFLQKKKSYSE